MPKKQKTANKTHVIYSIFKSSLKLDPKDQRDYKFKNYKVVAPDMVKLSESLPTFIDHSIIMSPVKYQGNLGSCVGFSVTAAKEWEEQNEYNTEKKEGNKYKRTDQDYNLSEQWLYWNCKKIDPWPNEEGTNFRSAMKVLQKIGIPTEEAWPYTDDPINIGKPQSWAHLIARWCTIGSYWSIETLEELKQALVDGPVVFGIPCFEEIFDPPADGYVAMPSNPRINYGYHAVCGVGYDDEKKIVKFKNSWSQFWGERGYGKLPYEFIDKYMTDAWVMKDIRVTPEMLKGKVSLT